MTQAGVALDAGTGNTEFRRSLRAHWPLVIGFVLVVIPTIVDLAHQAWASEFGAYGPIVLVTGGWLLWRRLPEIRQVAVPGRLWLALTLLIPSLAIFAFGHAFDVETFAAAGLFGVGLAILYLSVGRVAIQREWFPLLYLAFAIPPPHSLLLAATAPLKHLVSETATGWLAAAGIPVSHEGVTIFVAQYQLLVEDACSGMNSIVGLTAVSLLYIYLMRGSNWLYSLGLTLCVIPIAIVANILRIMVLILLTYYCGNDVAQGFLHFTAGIFLFTTAILFVFLVDKAVAYGLSRWRRAPA